ncbi:MAG: acyl carrier protein [Planctomycetota bacterium]|nr:MAG: acyl carrier protein [Planctomycetota bacterium]
MEIRTRIKKVLIDRLRLEGMAPEDIEDDMPLFGEGLGLDSVDALELIVGLEKEFDIKVDPEGIQRENLASVAALAAMVEGWPDAEPPKDPALSQAPPSA